MQALSARSTENDAGNGENLEENMKKDIEDIKKMLQRKKLGKKKKAKALKLLDELSEKAESCSAGGSDAGDEIKEDIEEIKELVKVKKFSKKKRIKAKALELLDALRGKAEGCGGRFSF